MDRKCYKSINMPKNEQKNLVFRIVRQIPAKMRLGSQYLCGFPEGTVEMREARLRALTHLSVTAIYRSFHVEMREARLRALTHLSVTAIYRSFHVEMREARLRALTHSRSGL